MAAAVREGDWKLIRVEGSSPMLFNIEEDLGETTNLAEKHSQKVQHMLDLLTAWESEMVDPLWVADGKWQENQIKKHSMDVIGRDAERSLP